MRLDDLVILAKNNLCEVNCMNLKSGTYYWSSTFPDAPSSPSINEDSNCDVLIVGG